MSLGATFLQKRFSEDGLLKKECFDSSFIENVSSKYPFSNRMVYKTIFLNGTLKIPLEQLFKEMASEVLLLLKHPFRKS